MGTSASPRHIRVFSSPFSVGGQKIASGCNFTLETFWSPGSRRTPVSPNPASPSARSHSSDSKDGDWRAAPAPRWVVAPRDRIPESDDGSGRGRSLGARGLCGAWPARGRRLPGVRGAPRARLRRPRPGRRRCLGAARGRRSAGRGTRGERSAGAVTAGSGPAEPAGGTVQPPPPGRRPRDAPGSPHAQFPPPPEPRAQGAAPRRGVTREGRQRVREKAGLRSPRAWAPGAQRAEGAT